MEASPQTYRFFCTFCGQQIVANPIVAGTEVECPHCQRSFYAPKRGRRRRRRSSDAGEVFGTSAISGAPSRWPDIHEIFAAEDHPLPRARRQLVEQMETESSGEVSLLPPIVSGMPWKFWCLAGTLAAVALAAFFYAALYQDDSAPLATSAFSTKTPEQKVAARRALLETADESTLEELRATVRDFGAEPSEDAEAAPDSMLAGERPAAPQEEFVEEKEPTLFPDAEPPATVKGLEFVSAPDDRQESEVAGTAPLPRTPDGRFLQILPKKSVRPPFF